jgi:hypothetical protein
MDERIMIIWKERSWHNRRNVALEALKKITKILRMIGSPTGIPTNNPPHTSLNKITKVDRSG